MMIKISDEQSMMAFGARLARACTEGSIIYLIGDLGAGKTTLARGFLRACGHAGPIRSPTYTLVEHYSMPDKEIFHIDLYRLSDPEEVEYLGLTDLVTDKVIGMIEWPERALGMIPKADISCEIQFGAEGQRDLSLNAYSERGIRIVEQALSSRSPSGGGVASDRVRGRLCD